MPRYFITIRGGERIEDDPDGTYLPDVGGTFLCRVTTIRSW